jgi:hypothetical protein
MCSADGRVFRPLQNLRRLEELERRVRHAERLLRTARWEVDRVARGEATLDDLATILDEQLPATTAAQVGD